MNYKSITIREAIEKVNDTWFLPAIQRPYDWGDRAKKKDFIYKLFDSILRRYPIGTLIVWETSKEIPFREFLRDYNAEKLEKIKPRGQWGKKDKLLIYDGQQRLQSLYSCLKYTFHGEILCYNLLFNISLNKEAEGFKFFDKHKEVDPPYLRMDEMYSCNRKEEAEFEEKVFDKLSKLKLSKADKLVVKNNLKNLWKLFVDEEGVQLLSYYPLMSYFEEKEVLDIFKRINTAGMQLTKLEILFSELKRVQFDFEENLWGASLKIKDETGGFSFGPDNILQILFLLITGTMRVDPERLEENDLNGIIEEWSKLKNPLKSFFYDFLYSEFKINHEKIIRSKGALTPLIIYFYYMKSIKKYGFKDFSSNANMTKMKKFLIVSQLKYWDIQGYIDNFNRIIKDLIENAKKKSDLDFPYEKLKNFVKKSKKRDYSLGVDDLNFEYQRWFVLKILTPNRQYNHTNDQDERFNPEIDHIFPETPKEEKPQKYYKWVKTIWNLQPVKGGLNGSKLNTPPQEFFSENPVYLKQYDHLPTENIKNKIWLDKNADKFIKRRKIKMIKFVRKEYGINVY